MTFLENEVKLDSLTQSDMLTNYRIMLESGNSYKISIFLEKISSIMMHYKSKPLLLILGIIAFIAGIFVIQSDDWQGGGIFVLIVGIALIIAYFLTRKHVITISPDGGKDLDIEVKMVSHERIEEFITKIQEAKQNNNATNKKMMSDISLNTNNNIVNTIKNNNINEKNPKPSENKESKIKNNDLNEGDLLIVKREIPLKDKVSDGNEVIHLKKDELVKYIETIKTDGPYPWYYVETEKGIRGYYVSLDFQKKI